MYNPKSSLTIIPTQCTIARDDEGHGGIGGVGAGVFIMVLVIDETC
jgi:hypothetical protein